MFFSGEGEFLSQRTVLIHGSVVEKREDKAENLQDNLPMLIWIIVEWMLLFF